jgi:hypothetical protein
LTNEWLRVKEAFSRLFFLQTNQKHMKLLWAVPVFFFLLEVTVYLLMQHKHETIYAVQYVEPQKVEYTLDQAWLMASESIREFNRVQP